MNLPARTSLTGKLLLPLLALLAASNVVAVVLVQHQSSLRLQQQMLNRARMLATAITYAAEGAEREGQLQRFVAALGSDRSIRDIAVIAGDPVVVIASTRNEWNERPPAVLAGILPDLDTGDPAGEQSQYDADDGFFGYTQPLLLSNSRKYGGDRSSGRIRLRLDARRFQAMVGRTTTSLGIWLAAMTFGLFACTWLLLHRLVLKPVQRIHAAIGSGQPVDGIAASGDELGGLAAAYQRAVDQQRAGEARVTHALAEVEGLLDAMSAPLIGLDREGRIVRWNQSAERFTGLGEAAVRGRPLATCGIGWPAAELLAAVETCRARHAPVELADRLLRRGDGSETFLHFTCCESLLGDATILILGQDVTERRLLQSQLAQGQKMESIGQLAAGIAHEINTPTQFVGDNLRFLGDGCADLAHLIEACTKLSTAAEVERPALAAEAARIAVDIDADYLLAEIPRAIAQSLEGTARIASIVGALKDIAHPDSDDFKPSDLNRVVSTTLTVARNEYKYHADLVVDLQPDLPAVTCLGGAIGQVVMNMVVNAAQAISERRGETRGTITVTTRARGGCVEIAIADTGPGIAPEILGRIFDPFFTTKPVGVGSGQGLFLAHAVVVKKHGGRIDVATQPGVGTTFTIVLPLERPAA